MYIKKNSLRGGCNVYLSMESGKGKEIGMDVSLIVLEKGESYTLFEEKKEAALLLFCGELVWQANGESKSVSRKSEFTEEASCLHVSAGTKVTLRASRHSEIYLQMVNNSRKFPPVFYAPEDIQIQRAGVSDLQGTMRRNIKTVFDYENAPYSNMVLGEVLNLPGKWSSYPPHFHPQPEVYFLPLRQAAGLRGRVCQRPGAPDHA